MAQLKPCPPVNKCLPLSMCIQHNPADFVPHMSPRMDEAVKRELNDRYLRSLKPPDAGRLEVSDTKRKGLRFRLSASGKAVWMYEKRIKGGKKRKHTFGGWPTVSLSNASLRALMVRLELPDGPSAARIPLVTDII